MASLVTHLTPELVDFVLRWLPTPRARVLEVGCGDGALTRLLADRGYEMLGLDPDAPDEVGFARATLEELEPRQEFDAAVAVRSLHHLHDPDGALDNLRDAITPGGRLVVFEFAIENVDATAERWLSEHRLPHPVTETDHHEVIPLGRLRDELERRFRPLLAEPSTYLAREAGREDLVAAEEAAIDAGQLKAAGMRLVLERP
jgi:SAM-dependent methyltransferase